MLVLYLLALVAVALVVWRMLLPADLRLNRRFLARFLKDSAGRGPSKVKLARVARWLPHSEIEEHVYYQVEAEYSDGSQQQATVQVLYPLESLQRQREQKTIIAADLDLMQNPENLLSTQTSTEPGEKFKEDPLRELTAERKLIEQKAAQFDREIEQLRHLNACTVLFPRLIAYDRAQHIALLGPLGVDRLDKVLHHGSADERLRLLENFLTTLAAFHEGCANLALSFPSRGAHNEQVVRRQLGEAIETLGEAGVLSAETSHQQILESTSPLWTAGADYVGPRLADASPRGLYVFSGEVRPLDYGRLRRDISLLDVVELLCDPAMPLAVAEELALMKHYLSARFAAVDEARAAERNMLRLAVYYRIVLAGHLTRHFCALKETPREKRGALAIPYWTPAASHRNLEALQLYLGQETELASLKNLLCPRGR